jgi:hypothetical protein
VVTQSVTSGLIPAGPRRDLVLKLLDAAATDDAVAQATQAYADDLNKRFDAMTQTLSTDDGVKQFKGRTLDRMKAANKLAGQLPEHVERAADGQEPP